MDGRGESAGPIPKNVLLLVDRKLEHAEDHVLLLGRKTSRERVAAFLLEMHGRLAAAHTITLPMSRLDIADYLGLTVETVSRALAFFRDNGALTFIGPTQREIALLAQEVARQRLAAAARDIRARDPNVPSLNFP